MVRIGFKKVSKIEAIEFDLERLTVIAGVDGAGKRSLMTVSYALFNALSSRHEGDLAEAVSKGMAREFRGSRRYMSSKGDLEMASQDAFVSIGEVVRAEGSLDVGNVLLYDTPLIIDGVFAETDDHRSDLYDALMTDSPDVNDFESEPEEYRVLMDFFSPGDLHPDGDHLSYRFLDGTSIHARLIPADVKPFAMIKRLRKKGLLGRGSVLLLVNPDSGLHAGTINRFGEVILHLVRDMGVSIIVSTNSSHMLEGLRKAFYPYEGLPDYNLIVSKEGVVTVNDLGSQGCPMSIALEKPMNRVCRMYREFGEAYKDSVIPTECPHISIRGVRGLPDMVVPIGDMTLISGSGKTSRAGISKILHSILEPLSSDHNGEDRVALITFLLNGYFGSLDEFRVPGTEAVIGSDGVRVEVNGSVEIQGGITIPHVVYIPDALILESPSRGRGLAGMLVNPPVSSDVSEPDLYVRLMGILCPGEMEWDGSLFLYSSSDGMVVPFDDVPTGLRLPAILKRLRSNGVLCRDSVLIIDEPDVHIFPDNIHNLIELLVVMSKYMGIRILMTTHGVHPVSAFPAFACKHALKPGYVMVMDESNAVYTFEDIRLSMSPAYDELNDFWFGVP